MWTRIYLLLIALRLYFALSPSYIHPDENFQGPEIIAGEIFSYKSHRTWEFTASDPARSVFPLWPIYGLPMVLYRWLTEAGSFLAPSPPPRIVFYTLRLLMFLGSFVLEDWALHELVPSPRRRRAVIMLVASSYVTWTYQAHTLSNALETLAVLWSLVLIQRMLNASDRSSFLSSSILGVLAILGTFNRITFPAYLLCPALYLLPHFYRRPQSLLVLLLSASITLLLAIITDTAFYRPDQPLLHALLHSPVVAPYNSLMYNLSSDNLARHGLHPRYTHLLVNLPQLLGPAFPLLLYTLFRERSFFWDELMGEVPVAGGGRIMMLAAAVPALAILSALPHQEVRFLIPMVPLLICVLRLPHQRVSSGIRTPSLRAASPSRRSQTWWFLLVWAFFNVPLAVLFGTFHQAGVVPTQIWLGEHPEAYVPGVKVLWWRTYSPPVWLADESGAAATNRSITDPNDPEFTKLHTIDMMGANVTAVQTQIGNALAEACQALEHTTLGAQELRSGQVLLVAPRSRPDVIAWRAADPRSAKVPTSSLSESAGSVSSEQAPMSSDGAWVWHELHYESRHLGLDDLDAVRAQAARAAQLPYGDGRVEQPPVWWRGWTFMATLWRTRGLTVWRIESECL